MPTEPPFKLGTFSVGGARPFAGVVVEGRVVAAQALAALCARLGHELTRADTVLGLLENWPGNFAALRAAVDALRDDASAEGQLSGGFVDEALLRVHPPVDLPRQILCSGANYRKHVIDLIVAQAGPDTEDMSPEERRAHGERVMDRRAAEGKPFVFTKLPSTVVGPFDPVVLPPEAKEPDWELELGVVIGRPARRVPREWALEHVAGYVVVNDLTLRELVYRRDMPQMGMDWLACKSPPTFLPTGPYLVPAAFVPDPQALRVTLQLNGDTMQDESTADMIFGVARLVEFISAHVQLLPGDLICTGSPAGNGSHYNRFLRPGDVLEGSITYLGTQRNTCVAERLESDGDSP